MNAGVSPGAAVARAESTFDAIVIGGGAAGMFCAARAGQRGRRVLIVEHHRAIGEKIRISGGGRCNFTNVNSAPDRFLSSNPAFCAPALAAFTPRDFIAMVDRARIPWHEKKLGQLFCDRSAVDLIAMLKDACAGGGVTWWQPCSVQGVVREGGGFAVSTSHGMASARSLVIATGGLSVPGAGATPFGYEVAKQFGMKVIPPRPALVPLALPPVLLSRYGGLSGLSVDAEVRCNGGCFRENVLFTHRGLSGPAILQISSYWDGRTPIAIDLWPGDPVHAALDEGARRNMHVENVLARRLPRRFVDAWCEAEGVGGALKATSPSDRAAIAAKLSAWRVLPSGTLGWNKAEVTLGGVDTLAIDPVTMQAREVEGLHFIGEVVDVTGWLGGYNFQWAWASAHAAALAL